MNPVDPLAALQPLREPAAVGWWPLAPGWWLLLGLAICLLAAAAWYLWRRYRANAYRRHALRRLDGLFQRYGESGEQDRLLSDLNVLLKQVALHAFPAADVAGCSGERWLAFLNDSAPDGVAFPAEFAGAQYRREPGLAEPLALQQPAALWIRGHRSVS